jgi:hypothetical protein
MFGGAIFRIAKYAVIGAIALGLGSQLLSYTTSVVIAFRSGDSIPLILVFIVAISVLRLAGSSLFEEPTKTVVNILGWTAGIYLILTIFILSLDSGLVFSIIGTAMVTILCAIVRDPSEVVLRVNETFKNSLHLDLSRVSTACNNLSDNEIWSYAKELSESLAVLQISNEFIDSVLDAFRKRVKIPMSLHILNDITVLIVDSTKISVKDAITSLQLPDSCEIKQCPQTLSKAILALPLLNAHYGRSITKYSLVSDSESSRFLINATSPGTSIYPSKPDVSVLVPQELAIGLPSETLSQSEIYNLVLARRLPKIGVEKNDHT